MGDYEHGPVKLILRGTILLASLGFAIFDPRLLTALFTCPILFVRVYHVLWLAIVLVMVKRMIPQMNPKISSGKIFERHFRGSGSETQSKRSKLEAYKKKMDAGALRAAIYWSLVIVATGILSRYGILSSMALFIVVLFFIFMDQFCVTVWCPFKWIVENKCCHSCRINNWGYFMAFSPLIFVPSFWTYSILFLSIVIIVQWEYLCYRYPERIYEAYNANLMCRNCRSRCRKRPADSSLRNSFEYR
jgi:hypothetical protein